MDVNNAIAQPKPTAAPTADPNEMVTITNSKTREVKRVKRTDLPTYGLPVDYQSQSDILAKSIQDGSTDPTKLGTDEVSNGARLSLQSSGYDKAAIQAKKDSGEAHKNLDLFEKNYNEAGLKGNALMGLIPSGTGLSPESSDFDAQRQTLAYQLAKSIGGQSGQGLSDKDFAHYLDLVPSRGDTTQAASNKMNNIRQMIADKYNVAPTKSAIQGEPIVPSPDKTTGAVSSFVKDNVIDPIANFGQDVGAGAAMNGQDGQNAQASQQAAITSAQQAMAKAQQIQQTNPQEAQRLRQVAQDTLAQTGMSADQIAKSFSPDVNENPLERGIKVAGAMTAAVDAPSVAGAAGGAIKQAVTHPVQTAKAVVSAVKDINGNPIQAGVTALKNDYNASFGNKLPGAVAKDGVSLADGSSAVQNPSTTLDGNQLDSNTGQPGIVNKEPLNGNPAATGGNPNDMSLRDKLAKEFSTSVAVPNQGSVLKSEKLMQDAFRMTTAPDPRGVARELETNLPKYAEATEKYAKLRDQSTGLQPLTGNGNDGVLDQIMSKVKDTSAAQANPDHIATLQNILADQLKAGDLGAAGARNGITEGTNFEKMNQARTYLNSGLSKWFANGQPEGSPTNDLNSMKWEASTALKDIMSEGDKSGAFRDLLAKQHTALQVVPVLSKETLATGKVNSVGAAVGKVYNTIRGRTVLKGAERSGGDNVPQITLADGSAPIQDTLNTTPYMNNTPPQTANAPMQGAATTPVNHQKIQFDKRAVVGSPLPRKGSEDLLMSTSRSLRHKKN